jgi:synaptosomal-associated protein 25
MVLPFTSKPTTTAPVTNEPPRILTEEEQLLVSIDQGVHESLEATRRMLGLCEESKEAGIRTLVMLDEQGEQLDAIDTGMDRINAEMRDAEKNLEGLEKCCGLCVLPWKRTKNVEKSAAYSKTFKGNDDGKVNASGPRQIVSQNGMGPGSGYIQRITNDAREDEMEENLQQVSTMIGNLRNMACDMGSEIGNQNNQIERIQGKTDISQMRLDGANKRAKTLLKS